jgi:TetR/AcrR family transcriptional regulator, copper-responsive repressor
MENALTPLKPRGRPRAFDRDAALIKAMHLFWDKGYAGVSVADLSRELGINPPSLYAAFGDKRRLFEEAVGCYLGGEGSFAQRALTEEPTAKAAVARMLTDAAKNFTAWPNPPGCMVVLAATNCADEDQNVAAFLRSRRQAAEREIRKRIRRAISEGELPPDTEPGQLAGFVASVFHGMSLKARDGASRHELEWIATQAMAAWPAENP